ncbi:MAG: hypothetical protein H7A23_23305 [Leptospiraceae bacterium]|nr:hypothetical protein [Leptospiraceae bacterium]MCP5497495.1 hypothetical protein [Leptospiraceae bacterium]
MSITVKDIISKIPSPYQKDLEYIVGKLNQNNHECYLIGGSVRDLIMGRIPKEFDLTTSAKPDQIKKIFPKVIETGIKHGTVTLLVNHNPYELTTYRKDIGYTDGRRPDNVEYGATLYEDMKRRDFTMNAIALGINQANLIDNHNGIEDIQNKIIRTIGNPLERFGEDGLRPVRAIRFMSTLSFSIENETYKAIRACRDVTIKISVERFQDELNKIFLSNNPYIGLQELYTNDIYSLFIKNISYQINESQSLEKINLLNKTPLSLKVAYLFSYLYKQIDNSNLELILATLRYSKQIIKDSLFFNELFYKKFNLESPYEVRKILFFFLNHLKRDKLEEYVNGYASYLKIHHNSNLVVSFLDKVRFSLENKVPLTLADLAINGKDVLAKFPKINKKNIGIALQNCLAYVLEFPEKNNKEDLFLICEKIS